MSLVLMMSSSVLGPSGHMHVGFIIYLFYSLPKLFLSLLSCVVILCSIRNLVLGMVVWVFS